MGPARDGRRGRKKGRYGICLASAPAPDNGRKREEEDKSVPRRRHACTSPPECRHGRLEAVGAGGSPAPKRSSRPQGCMVAGERKDRGRGGGRLVSRPQLSPRTVAHLLAANRT